VRIASKTSASVAAICQSSCVVEPPAGRRWSGWEVAGKASTQTFMRERKYV
jgi:hypothetical protein